jgi:hypothetical protein
MLNKVMLDHTCVDVKVATSGDREGQHATLRLVVTHYIKVWHFGGDLQLILLYVGSRTRGEI